MIFELNRRILSRECASDCSRYIGPAYIHVTVFNLLPEILNISRRPESVSCSHPLMSSSSSIGRDTPSLNPCPVIRVQDTSSTLSLLPDNLRNSFNPPSVRLLHQCSFRTTRFGREFTPTPVMSESDKSNSLRLLPYLFSISIILWFDDEKHQRISPSFSKLGRALGRRPMISPVFHTLRMIIDLKLRLENIFNTISFLSSLLLITLELLLITQYNPILIVSSSSCFLNKSLNTGPHPPGIREEIFNSKKKIHLTFFQVLHFLTNIFNLKTTEWKFFKFPTLIFWFLF